MDYEIIGETMPLVTLTLNKGEIVKSQAEAMKWMDDTEEKAKKNFLIYMN